MRVGPEQTAGPAEAEVRSTASRGIDAASWSVAAIAASAHGGIRRPALCLEEAEVSLFPVRDFSRRLRIPSEFAYLCKIRKVMDNFIVSARKYRPATFASVVGQSHITSTLRNAIARRQLAHAVRAASAKRPARAFSPRRSTASIRPPTARPATSASRAGRSTRAARSISTSWTPHRTTRWTIFVR